MYSSQNRQRLHPRPLCDVSNMLLSRFNSILELRNSSRNSNLHLSFKRQIISKVKTKVVSFITRFFHEVDVGSSQILPKTSPETPRNAYMLLVGGHIKRRTFDVYDFNHIAAILYENYATI